MLDKITGEVRIFANEIEVGKGKSKEVKTVYNTCIGAKKTVTKTAKGKEIEDWMNCYMNVNLSRDLEKEVKDLFTDKQNYVDVIIKDAWFSCYKSSKDELVHPILFINKAKVVK